jgi:hypothetical protein
MRQGLGMGWIVAAALTVPLAGCAAGGTPKDQLPPGQQVSFNDGKTLDQALAGLTPGQPVSCLPQARSPTSSGYGSTVLYRVSRTEIYRNDLGPGCEGVGRGDIMVTQNPIGRSCRGDIIQLLDRGSRFPTGSCAFSDFVPYRRAK